MSIIRYNTRELTRVVSLARACGSFWYCIPRVRTITMTTILDAKTLETLEGLNSFYIQQRFRWGEALTQGCWEQKKYYDVFDKATNKRIMIIKEESEGWSRVCCAPGHSFMIKFYHVGEDAPQHAPGEKIDWSYEPTAPAAMTMERGGCDCFCGSCPKPCLCCFECTPGCSDEAKLYSGDIEGKPGENFSNQIRDSACLLGGTVQSKGGGGFTPTLQVMDRGGSGGAVSSEPQQFAVAKGPCCFGGCSELCFDTEYGLSKDEETALGDYATITKKKPASFSRAAREALTDSDIYEVEFTAKEITPEQKANVLATVIHLDYMFFERDNDMVYYDSQGLHIVFFNCFCYGCVCPCQVVLNNNGGS